MGGPFDEWLVVNDGSEDSTGQLLREWARSDNRVRILEGRGEGLVKSLNLGLRECANEFVARFDVDDQYSASRLSLQRAAMSSNVVACFADYEFITENSISCGIIPSAVYSSAVSVSLVSSQRTAHPSVLFSKSAVLDVGGYREEDFPAEDLSLWLRMSRVGDLISIPMVLLHYRLSQGSISMVRRSEMQNRTQDLIRRIGIRPTDVQHVLENWNSICVDYEDHEFDWQRRLLLFLELKRLKKLTPFTKLQRGYFRDFEKYLWTHPECARALASLSLSAFRRKALRRSII